MPRLLYRYILSDLLRVIGLTTAVLVTVIAFGAMIGPLSGDSIVTAGQALRYLALILVPMLQYALPFAAAFGATLTLHRMVSDNEIQAMAASGISYRRILLPVIGLGLALTVFMVVLTQFVIPRFYLALERVVTRDVTRMFESRIKRHEPFLFGDLKVQIYADDIILKESSAPNPTTDGGVAGAVGAVGGGPDERMILMGVAAAETDDQGRITTDVTANQAVIDVYRRDGRTYFKLALSDTVVYQPDTGTLARSERVVPEHAILVPSVFKDNPKAKTRGQLLALRQNPDSFGKVIEARTALAAAIRDAQARNKVNAQFEASGVATLLGDHDPQTGKQRTYQVSADRLSSKAFVCREKRPIEIVQMEGAEPRLRFVAQEALLTRDGGNALGASAFDLVLKQVQVFDLRDGGASNSRSEIVFNNLSVTNQPDADEPLASSAELIQRAGATSGGSTLTERVRDLDSEINSLNMNIMSQLLSRYALSLTAMLLLVMGATLAVWQRGSLPLTVYAWGFIPAVIDLVLISTGTQLLRDGRLLGHFTMWSGNALIALVIAVAFVKLSRH